MTGVLVIYRGLPASGKTSLAQINAHLDGGRLVGRDHIRPLVGAFGKLGDGKQEGEVTRIQTQLIIDGLRNDESVHVDDQNLKTEYVRRLQGLAKREGAEVTIIDITNVPVEECLRRDAARPGPDLSKVIVTNYNKFINGKDFPLPVPQKDVLPGWLPAEPYVADPFKVATIIVDLDGTLADHGGIRGHHEYHRVGEDSVNVAVRSLVWNWLGGGRQVVFLSGRPDSCREETERWLARNLSVYGTRLLMRKTGDRRADFIVKRELFDQHIRHQHNVVFAVDDRNQVVDMWRQLGITTFQVAEGNF